MLHHVSLEVAPEHVPTVIALFEALGFARVEAPERLGEYVDWVERDGTQVHLIKTPEPRVPQLGHAAVVTDDFDATWSRLEDVEGVQVEEHEQLWGERRAFAVGPAGLRVEFMAAPPPPRSNE